MLRHTIEGEQHMKPLQNTNWLLKISSIFSKKNREIKVSILPCRKYEKSWWRKLRNKKRIKRKRLVKKEKGQKDSNESKLLKVLIVKRKNLLQNHKLTTKRTTQTKIIKMRLKFKRLDHKKPKKATSSKMKIWKQKRNGGRRKSLITTSMIKRRKQIRKKLTRLQRKWQN